MRLHEQYITLPRHLESYNILHRYNFDFVGVTWRYVLLFQTSIVRKIKDVHRVFVTATFPSIVTRNSWAN